MELTRRSSESVSSRLQRLDGERLQALSSPMRPRHLNPEGFEAKITFWTSIIVDLITEDNLVYINKADLERRLISKDPRLNGIHCLNEVLHRLIEDNKLVLEHTFFNQTLSWPMWMANNASTVFKRWLRGDAKESLNSDVELVSTLALDNLAAILHYRLCGKIIKNVEDIDNEENDVFVLTLENENLVLTNDNLDAEVLSIVSKDQKKHLLLVDFLRRQCWAHFDEKEQLWTFCKKRTDISTPLSDSEIAYTRLLLRLRSLEREAKHTEVLAFSKRSLAKEALKAKKRESAKMHLKLALRLEANLSKKTKLVDQLHSVVSDLKSSKEAKDHVALLKMAMEALKSNNLSLEEAEEVLDDLKLCQEEVTEVTDALSHHHSDDDQLEVELQQLVAEEDEKLVDALANLDVNNDPVVEVSSGDAVTQKDAKPVKKMILQCQQPV